jgi:hypothetical protein
MIFPAIKRFLGHLFSPAAQDNQKMGLSDEGEKLSEVGKVSHIDVINRRTFLSRVSSFGILSISGSFLISDISAGSGVDPLPPNIPTTPQPKPLCGVCDCYCGCQCSCGCDCECSCGCDPSCDSSCASACGREYTMSQAMHDNMDVNLYEIDSVMNFNGALDVHISRSFTPEKNNTYDSSWNSLGNQNSEHLWRANWPK